MMMQSLMDFQYYDGKYATCSKDGTIKLIHSYLYIPKLDETTKVVDNDRMEIYYRNQITERKFKTDILHCWKGHSTGINQVFPLIKKRIASCSDDNTVKIWEIEEPYNLLHTFTCSSKVIAIYQLKRKYI